MTAALLVYVGSGLGGLLRWWIDRLFPAETVLDPLNLQLDGLPVATILANVTGSALSGFVLNLPPESLGQEARLFLTVGFAGGFTTLSAFNAQTLLLLQQGELVTALINIAVTLGVSFLALVIGYEAANLAW